MWWLLILLLLLFVCFDVHYFLRAIWSFALSYTRGRRQDVLTESILTSRCLTTDLDVMLHMNNARYLRECDFARFRLWLDTGIWRMCRKLRGNVTLGASTIRYRKSLELGDPFIIKTRIVCWDDRAFYVEQKIVRQPDDFICAIVYIKQVFSKVTPSRLVKEVSGRDIPSPPIPGEIQAFIECHQISSDKLKKAS